MNTRSQKPIFKNQIQFQAIFTEKIFNAYKNSTFIKKRDFCLKKPFLIFWLNI